MKTVNEWKDPDGSQMELECTNCGFKLKSGVWLAISEPNGDGPNYCPHCGAKNKLQLEGN